MEKLSIREASERFGLSRARLYKLLEKGAIAGHRSEKKGRGAGSWINGISLQEYLNINKPGRPQVVPNGKYLPVIDACNISGYSDTHVYRLVEQGSITYKKGMGNGILIYLPDLMKYKNQ